MLVGIALFILRSKGSKIIPGYKVSLYPWIPILFCLSTFFMLYASLSYAYGQRHPEAYWIIAIMVIGILVSSYDPPRVTVKTK